MSEMGFSVACRGGYLLSCSVNLMNVSSGCLMGINVAPGESFLPKYTNTKESGAMDTEG